MARSLPVVQGDQVTVNDVPRLGSLLLGRSGAAFELSRPARENTSVSVGSWRIATERGSALVVARGRVSGYPGAVRAGLNHAEQGLDMLSLRGIDDATLAGGDYEHLAWWASGAGLTLRIVSTTLLQLPTVRATIEARDARGRLIRPPRPRPMPWHPSFRFFRMAQTTDDLFDAFRNSYLALECILAERTPQRRRAPGRPAEQEGDWFRRALLATGIELERFAPRRRRTPAVAIYDRLYRDARVRVFHAKPDRDPIVPHDRQTTAVIAQALDLAQRLYLAIVEAHFGVTRLGGAFSEYAARGMLGSVLEPMAFVATSDESSFSPDGTVVAPAGAQVRPIPHSSPVTYRGFEGRRLAWASGSELADLPFIRRVVGVSPAGQPMTQTRLEARLDHRGIACLEIDYRIVLRNGRDLAAGVT